MEERILSRGCFSFVFIFSFFVIFSLFNSSVLAALPIPPSKTFQSGEHSICGDNIYILFPQKNLSNDYDYVRIRGGSVNFADWLFPNQKTRHRISYGTIVAMPDFFANGSQAISDGISDQDQLRRFIASFNVFSNETSSHIQVMDNVIDIINEEISLINSAKEQGKQPSQEYSKQANHFYLKYVYANPSMFSLMLNMVDHFGWSADHDPAWIAYSTGHRLALEKALMAHDATSIEDKNKLIVLAYAINAYACHFLADRFAAGHLRMPFKSLQNTLAKEGKSELYGNVVGGLLLEYMHNEDNHNGLEVTNKRGDKWVAYGDDKYSDDVNTQNRKLVNEALQKSADEIANAFIEGIVLSNGLEDIIIDIDVLSDAEKYVDNINKTIPLFAFNNKIGELFRRNNINRLRPTNQNLPFDYNQVMIKHGFLNGGWNGLVTLLKLKLMHNPHYTSKEEYPELDDNINDLYLASNGELNDIGKKELSNRLDHVNKLIICSYGHNNEIAKIFGIDCGNK